MRVVGLRVGLVVLGPASPELLRVARDAQSLVYNPSPIVLAALLYLALLLPLVRWLSRLEHRGRTLH